jgi:hypothetical protein
MAIAIDVAQDGNKSTSNSAALTYSHTCAVDAVLYVWVGVGSSRTVTVTYNGVSMTEIANEPETNGDRGYLFFLGSPASGANNVVITPSGNTFIVAQSSSYTGASTTAGQVHTIGANGSSVTSLTNTINISDADAWMASGCGFQRAPTASTGSVLRNSSALHNLYTFDTNGVVGSTGNRSMAYTMASISAQFAIAVEILPAGAGGGAAFIPKVSMFM